MSRLFNALKSLEGEAAGHDAQAPPITYQRPFPPKRFAVWTRPLLMVTLFLAIGLIVLYAFQRWGKGLMEDPFRPLHVSHGTTRSVSKALPPIQAAKRGGSDFIHEEAKIQTAPEELPKHYVQKNKAKQKAKGHSPLPAAKHSNKPAPKTLHHSNPGRNGRKSPVQKMLSYTSKSKAKAVVYQNMKLPDVLPNAATQTGNRPDYRRLKNILLIQAEEYRMAGKWNLALKSYEKLWGFSKEPDIANNYAGVLIILGKYEDALAILKEALKTAPNDGDIKRNLKIAQRKYSEQTLQHRQYKTE